MLGKDSRIQVMRVALLLLMVGCNRGTPPAPVTPAPAPPASTDVPSTRKIIASDRTDFQEMVKAFEANSDAATKLYKRQMLRLEMTVDTVKETGKNRYVVNGKVGSVAVVSTFYTQPNLDLNRQVKEIGPKDKVTFSGELASFKAGQPRSEITIESGAIESIENVAK
jgi:hypothetical protein